MKEDPRFQRTRDAVRRAVQGLVVEHGLTAVTHARVAERAGVGRATMYRHWSDRRALLQDGLGHARFAPPPRSGRWRDDVLALLAALRDAMVHGPLRAVLAALLADALHDGATADLLDALLAEGHDALSDVLADAVSRGDLPALPIDDTVRLLGGVVFYGAFVRREALPDEALRAAVDRILPPP
ncbi:MAG: TetR/AcrR family transcriptional regulator [Myxococcales bacterium]|nr:TetR/AcrR family transcriptional regulator [Myxococcales bacterium]